MATPTYSPQLNLIEREMCRGFLGLQNRAVEILWRFMKYEWIETEAYFSWQNLKKYVEQILRDFGNRYVINFA